jgi:iron complex outermembrane receptor protein
LASRYKLTDNINLRGAVSTGFRAPSLHQIYFNSTSTLFTNGVPSEVGTFSNDSQVAKLLGIPQLKQEESQSASVGFTAKIPEARLTLTADAYIVRIDDRVVLTDQFVANTPELVTLFNQAGANKAGFFANAIDTESKGIDIVISHKANVGNGLTLKTDLSGTISSTKRVGSIHASKILEDAGQINSYYSESSRVYLQEAVPRVKANLTNSISVNKFDFFLRNVYFGQVTDPNTGDANGDGAVDTAVINGKTVAVEHPIWGAKVITDLSVGYKFTESAKIVIGANNLFDVYPDENLESLKSSNQFTYSRNVSQFGQNGRFLFARLSFSF